MLSVGESPLFFAGRASAGTELGSGSLAAAFRTGSSLSEQQRQTRSGSEDGARTDLVGDAMVKAYETAANRLADAAATGAGVDDGADAETQKVIASLKDTDTAVRAHESAHKMVGGSYVQGGASYTYQIGPDGRQYAIGGEVSIDTSAESVPAETIRKMSTVRAAALAPADPSAQDRAVAAMASQVIVAAQAELRSQSQQSVEPGGTDPTAVSTAEGAGAGSQQSAPRGIGALVASAYAAITEPAAEPTFRAAA